ncbi:MAG: DNA-directed DNA polymerase II small subunit [Candidatus Micrarchaeota archaeon]
MDRKQLLEAVASNDLVIEPQAVECVLAADDSAKLLDSAIINVVKSNDFVITHRLIDDLSESLRLSKISDGVEGVQPGFVPLAASVKSRLEVNWREDVSNQSRCTGKIEDFVSYFRDRFKRIKLMYKLRGVEVAPSLKQVKEANNRDRKTIVGMVNSTKTTKNGHFLIELEDEEGVLNCLVPKDSDFREQAANIMLDEVIAFTGYLSDSLFIVKEISWPEIPIRAKKLCEEDSCIAFLSDLHVGSKFFLGNEFNSFLNFLNGKGTAEEQEAASKIKYMLIAGDLVDGIGVYPTQEKQLVTKDIYAQYELCWELLKKIPQHIEIVISPGNHDAVRNAEPQPKLLDEFTEDLKGFENIHLVGNPAWIKISDLRVLIYHGTSMDTIIAAMPNMSIGYQQPERVGVEMLRRRHLSPVYGEKPIVPEQRDFMVIDDVPDIFHFGHVHKNGYKDYRGTLIVNSGTWQDTTDFQVKIGHVPSPCQLPVYNIKTGVLKTFNFRGEAK